MVMGSLPEQLDLVVLGGGAAGYSSAVRAGQLGLSVAVVEKGEIGGHCVNFACIPARVMRETAWRLFSAKADRSLKGDLQLDWRALVSRRDEVTKRIRDNILGAFDALKVEFIKGEGVIRDRGVVEVQNQTLLWKNLVVATGAETVIPKEIQGSEVVDYRWVFSTSEVPGQVGVIGAGVTGTEIAFLLSRLGVKVTLMGEDLLPGFDPDIVSLVRRNLDVLGVKFLKGKVSRVDGKTAVAQNERVEADKFVAATGMREVLPRGLDKVLGKGELRVGQDLRVAEGVFLVGDASGLPMNAQKAMRQGAIASEVIAGKPSAFDNRTVPLYLFTEPEVVVAGELKGEKVVFRTNALGWSVATGSAGLIKVFYREDGLINGLVVAGRGASELAGEVSLLVEMGAFLEDLSGSIHAHPTLSEALAETALIAQGRSVYSLGKR